MMHLNIISQIQNWMNHFLLKRHRVGFKFFILTIILLFVSVFFRLLNAHVGNSNFIWIFKCALCAYVHKFLSNGRKWHVTYADFIRSWITTITEIEICGIFIVPVCTTQFGNIQYKLIIQTLDKFSIKPNKILKWLTKKLKIEKSQSMYCAYLVPCHTFL